MPRRSGNVEILRAFLSTVCTGLLTPLVNSEHTAIERQDTLNGFVGCTSEHNPTRNVRFAAM